MTTPLHPMSPKYGSVEMGQKSKSQLAREAHKMGDIEASKAIHFARSEEKHNPEGGYIKTITLGGLDGCLTALALITSCAGSGIPWQGILAMGMANILADAFSMGIGEFLSEKGEVEYILQEKEREEWELKNYKKGEIEEMIQLYVRKGMSRVDAEKIIGALSHYDDFFVDLMMAEELELTVPEEDWKCDTAKSGVVMFFGFLFFGLVPLLGYVILPIANPNTSVTSLLMFAMIVTALALFLLGALRGVRGVGGWIKPGMETVILGSACAALAFGISTAIRVAFGLKAL